MLCTFENIISFFIQDVLVFLSAKILRQIFVWNILFTSLDLKIIKYNIKDKPFFWFMLHHVKDFIFYIF